MDRVNRKERKERRDGIRFSLALFAFSAFFVVSKPIAALTALPTLCPAS
jgi:hypothetical protein